MSEAIRKVFISHPESVGETYSEHFVVASSFGWKLFVASMAAFMHGIFPCLFKTTASRCIRELVAKTENRGK